MRCVSGRALSREPSLFLGYSFRWDRDRYGRARRYWNQFPAPKSLVRERARLREMTGPGQCFKPLPELIGELNAHLRGWANYFGRGYPRDAFARSTAPCAVG